MMSPEKVARAEKMLVEMRNDPEKFAAHKEVARRRVEIASAYFNQAEESAIRAIAENWSAEQFVEERKKMINEEMPIEQVQELADALQYMAQQYKNLATGVQLGLLMRAGEL